jgi:hypothetical protein
MRYKLPMYGNDTRKNQVNRQQSYNFTVLNLTRQVSVNKKK